MCPKRSGRSCPPCHRTPLSLWAASRVAPSGNLRCFRPAAASRNPSGDLLTYPAAYFMSRHTLASFLQAASFVARAGMSDGPRQPHARRLAPLAQPTRIWFRVDPYPRRVAPRHTQRRSYGRRSWSQRSHAVARGGHNDHTYAHRGPSGNTVGGWARCSTAYGRTVSNGRQMSLCATAYGRCWQDRSTSWISAP
jgi:hypothetical protein